MEHMGFEIRGKHGNILGKSWDSHGQRMVKNGENHGKTMTMINNGKTMGSIMVESLAMDE